MSNVAALKKKAADFEQRKQLDKAIAAYREILDVYDTGGEANIDVGLYNRVADLLMRQGATPEAVTLFERAVDLYTEGGFFNNAIALCNKILRTSPGRASVYYKLGKISAAKGFKGDAKQNFLEYADRMQKSGHMQEAFRALKEFADLCPDQDDIRLLLAEQLTKADKKPEALEQLQLLYTRYSAEGRTTEAQATVERMKAIDPTAEARSIAATDATKADADLVFLDLNAPSPRSPRRTLSAARIPGPDPTLPLIEVDSGSRERARRDGAAAKPLDGLEPTAFDGAAPTQPTPLPASEFAQIDLGSIPEAHSAATHVPGRDLALPGDLPAIVASESPDHPWTDFRMIEPTPLSADAVAEASAAGVSVGASLHIEPTALDGSVDPSTDAGKVAPGLPAMKGEAEADAGLPVLTDDAPETPTGFGTVALTSTGELPPARRNSSALAASAGVLAARLAGEAGNWALHREYAEALLEGGDRETGLKELEKALVGFEKADDLDAARAIADEIIHLRPSSVRHHQKRVEYAYRSADRTRLAQAYVELADALFRDGQAEKAKVVYERVLEIAPADLRAHAALEAYGAVEAPGDRAPTPQPAAPASLVDAAESQPAPPAPSANSGDGYVSLGDWLRADEAPKSTRMVIEEEEPSGDEQRDFDDMLRKFKQGVAENVDEEDHAAHYDLGVAYKEMGLVDEAIAQFQKAFRGSTHRVRTYEALGQCFLEKQQLQVAVTVLQRALHEPGVGDEQLVGVLYLLGYINESMERRAEAKGFYERVFGVDIQFRDVSQRLHDLEKALA